MLLFLDSSVKPPAGRDGGGSLTPSQKPTETPMRRQSHPCRLTRAKFITWSDNCVVNTRSLHSLLCTLFPKQDAEEEVLGEEELLHAD